VAALFRERAEASARIPRANLVWFALGVLTHDGGGLFRARSTDTSREAGRTSNVFSAPFASLKQASERQFGGQIQPQMGGQSWRSLSAAEAPARSHQNKTT